MHGVGVDCIDVESATNLDIQVTNAASSNQNAVAEYTIGLILDLAKNITCYHNGLSNGNWAVRNLCGLDVSGKTLGIIGYGQIGQKVAKKAYHGLDMKVCVYKRNIKERFEQDGILFTNQMDEVIKHSDFLSLHVPFTSSTHHLIGKRELAVE